MDIVGIISEVFSIRCDIPRDDDIIANQNESLQRSGGKIVALTSQELKARQWVLSTIDPS